MADKKERSTEIRPATKEHAEAPMTFEKLHADYSACKCLESTMEDCESSFMRRSHNHLLHEDDLLTKWEIEKSKGVQQPTRCSDIRPHKGWSVNIVDSRGQELLQIDQDNFQNHPLYSCRYVHVLKVKANRALVDVYGGKRNPSHRNIWKSDAFELSSLNITQTIDLSDV